MGHLFALPFVFVFVMTLIQSNIHVKCMKNDTHLHYTQMPQCRLLLHDYTNDTSSLNNIKVYLILHLRGRG